MTIKDKRIILAILSMCLTTAVVVGQNSPKVQWGRQIVTPTQDSIFGTMIVDSNDGIYVSILRTPRDASDSDYKEKHLLKFNQDGKQLWSRQLDATEGENLQHLEVDGLAADNNENIYVFGTTDSQLGQEQKGGFDTFIILLCIEGQVELNYTTGGVTLEKGETVLLPATTGTVSLKSDPGKLLEIYINNHHI